MRERHIKQRVYTVDHEVHDSLGHEISDGLVDNANVRIYEVADGFNLALQLRVHRHCVGGIQRIFILLLEKNKTRDNETEFICILHTAFFH